MSPNTAATYKVDIQEAVLKVCMVELAPDVVLAHGFSTSGWGRLAIFVGSRDCPPTF